MPNGLKEWPPSYWKELLEMTIEAMNTVSSNASDWSFGGGTSLAIDLNHRISYDIDAFLDSANLIKKLVPNTNEVTKKICWDSERGRAKFDWPGNYLKLIIPNQKGEIDFINTSTVLDDPYVSYEFNGTKIQRERPAEVLAKKIRYRSNKFKARDAFDLASIYIKQPEEIDLIINSNLFEDAVYKRMLVIISLKKDEFQNGILKEVNPTEFGSSFINDATDISMEALDKMLNKVTCTSDKLYAF